MRFRLRAFEPVLILRRPPQATVSKDYGGIRATAIRRYLARAMKPYERTKLYDLASAAPLIALYGWTIMQNGPLLAARYASLRNGDAGIEAAAETLAHLLALIFAGLLIVLLFIRTVPVCKLPGASPRIAAVLGTGSGLAILMLPAAALPYWIYAFSATLILAGLSGAAFSMLWLRRSFSVMPEARRLVTRGPYAVIRHPVYLFEEIALFGIMLQFARPWAFLIFAAQFGFQLMRIGYEEKVLSGTFPGYAPYAARTWRLIPGLY